MHWYCTTLPNEARMSAFSIRPLGDGAVMLLLDGETFDLRAVRRVGGIASRVRARLGAFALDVIPAYASVVVRFDPKVLSGAFVTAALRGAAERQEVAAARSARSFRIGVQFGEEYGDDLERTAREVGLKPNRYVERFCKATYEVAFLGFIAGFPYLLGLPPELAAPRLASPRDRVPPGSVGIAGPQCGIYPRESPGGWRLLGRTNAVMFDPARDPAALLLPGDVVRFMAVRKTSDAGAEAMRR